MWDYEVWIRSVQTENREKIKKFPYLETFLICPQPSKKCEAGLSTASHVHLARKYNGEWIPADSSLPMILSGWRAHAMDAYEGTLTKGDLVRTACECRDDEYNGITAE